MRWCEGSFLCSERCPDAKLHRADTTRSNMHAWAEHSRFYYAQVGTVANFTHAYGSFRGFLDAYRLDIFSVQVQSRRTRLIICAVHHIFAAPADFLHRKCYRRARPPRAAISKRVLSTAALCRNTSLQNPSSRATSSV